MRADKYNKMSALHPAGPVLHPARPMLHLAGPVLHPAGPVLHLAGPVLHPAGPMLHPSGPMLHPAGPVLHPAGPVLHPAWPVLHPASWVPKKIPLIPQAKKIDLVDNQSKDIGWSYKFNKKVINHPFRRRVAKYHTVSMGCPMFRNYDISLSTKH